MPASPSLHPFIFQLLQLLGTTFPSPDFTVVYRYHEDRPAPHVVTLWRQFPSVPYCTESLDLSYSQAHLDHMLDPLAAAQQQCDILAKAILGVSHAPQKG